MRMMKKKYMLVCNVVVVDVVVVAVNVVALIVNAVEQMFFVYFGKGTISCKISNFFRN